MKNIALLIAGLFFISLSADGQSLLNRLKEKTSAKANQRAEQKVDQSIDKGLDGLENLFNKKPKKSSEESEASGDEVEAASATDASNFQRGSSSSAPAEGETEYSFKHRVTLKMTMHEGKKAEEEVDYIMLIAEDDANYSGAEIYIESDGEQVKATMVFDLENKSSLVLMNQSGMKIAMRQKMDFDNSDADYAGNSEDYDYAKTGRTKSILGYTCQEFEVTFDGGYSQVWITDELEMKSILSSLSELSKNGQFANLEGPFNGFVMEMVSWSKGKNKGDKVEMRVTKIERDKPTDVSTAGYTIMGG